jgi:hypothetical protein
MAASILRPHPKQNLKFKCEIFSFYYRDFVLRHDSESSNEMYDCKASNNGSSCVRDTSPFAAKRIGSFVPAHSALWPSFRYAEQILFGISQMLQILKQRLRREGCFPPLRRTHIMRSVS